MGRVDLLGFVFDLLYSSDKFCLEEYRQEAAQLSARRGPSLEQADRLEAGHDLARLAEPDKQPWKRSSKMCLLVVRNRNG